MTDKEAIKLMAETIQEGTTKFIGESCSEGTVNAIKGHMQQILRTFAKTAGIYDNLPRVEVTADYGLRKANISFFDSKTGEPLDIYRWISRVKEGFYDRR